MKLKNNCIEGEVFVVAKDLFDAVGQVDSGIIYADEDKAEEVASCQWEEKVFRVEVKVYEA